jgi:hypothetical protein
MTCRELILINIYTRIDNIKTFIIFKVYVFDI